MSGASMYILPLEGQEGAFHSEGEEVIPEPCWVFGEEDQVLASGCRGGEWAGILVWLLLLNILPSLSVFLLPYTIHKCS